jgi:preprotein translocase subunit SecD
MISNNSKYPALLLLLCVGFGCKNFSLLMNKGGMIYTVEIQTDEPNKDEIVERAVKVTQSRMNSIGIDGEVAKIPDKPNQISVKLYDVKDPERIKKFLFTTNQLELKKVSGSSYQTFPTFPTKEAAEKAATKDQEVLPFTEREDTVPANSERKDSAPSKFIVVEKKAIITGAEIRTASAYSRTGGASDYQIQFALNSEGAVNFGDWTRNNIGSYLAIVLDKKVISAPVIKGQIFDSGVIEGRFTKQSAEDIALSLKSGYLSAKMILLEEKVF